MKITRSIAAVPLRNRLIVAGLLFTIATVVAYGQFTAEYRWHERHSWWLMVFHPIDWNVDAGLPDMGNLHAVQVIDGKPWIAGNSAFLAFSDDRGSTWTRMNYDEKTGTFAMPGVVPSTPPSRSLLDRLAGVPVYAASEQQSAAQQQAPVQQQPAKAPNAAATPNTPNVPQRALVVAEPDDVDFGITSGIFFPQTRTITIRNPTPLAAQLRLTIVQSANAFGFVKSSCPTSELPRGDRCEIVLEFRAVGAQGRYDADLIDDINGTRLAHLHGVSESNVQVSVAKGGPPTQKEPPAPNPAPPQTQPPQTTQTQPPRTTTPPRTPPPPALPKPGPPRQGLDLLAFVDCSGLSCELDTRTDRFVTGDYGLTWTFRPGLTAAAPTPPPKDYQLVDDALSRSDDGGMTWVPLNRKAAAALPGHAPVLAGTRYRSLVAPWYLFAVLFIALLVAVEEEVEPDQQRADRKTDVIEPKGTADKPLQPGEPDALELNKIATGLGFFLRNEKTEPPLVIAINGRWGSGKSSLMNLVRQYLEAHGSRPVWFNAWHHQKEDQLLAALLDAVKRQAVPTLATRQGWMFRARLAWARLRQAWLEASIAVALVVLFWQAETYLNLHHSDLSAGHLLHQAVASLFSADGGPSDFKQLLETFDKWVATAGALLFMMTRAFRGVRAFASKPASLLAADAPGSSAKQLQEQTGFRQQFAREFGDVTRALGTNQRMLILIDDLDRCRPEKVRDVLEAVNFLVSSGECFVILGMAREIVRHCVGLSFSRVVDSMPWEAFDLPKEEITRLVEHTKREFEEVSHDVTASEVTKAARRAAFADLFLDKLVQIEISIPEPSATQKRKLFESKQRTETAAQQRVQRWLRASASVGNVLQPILYGTIVAGILIAAGLEAGSVLRTMIERAERADVAPLTNIDSEASQAPAPVTPTPRPDQPTADGRAGAPPGPPAYLVDGAPVLTVGWRSEWPFALAVLMLISAAIGSLRRVPQPRVEDTQVFTDAMQIWHPLVLTSGARNTPRTARRFQNRVRYLAMRQRALKLDAQLSRGERWLYRLAGAPLTPAAPAGDAVTQAWAAAIPDRIPEDMLVALAAIHESRPDWLTEFSVFKTHLLENIDNPPEVSTAINQHSTKQTLQWRGDALAAYRGLYLELSSELDRTPAPSL